MSNDDDEQSQEGTNDNIIDDDAKEPASTIQATSSPSNPASPKSSDKQPSSPTLAARKEKPPPPSNDAIIPPHPLVAAVHALKDQVTPPPKPIPPYRRITPTNGTDDDDDEDDDDIIENRSSFSDIIRSSSASKEEEQNVENGEFWSSSFDSEDMRKNNGQVSIPINDTDSSSPEARKKKAKPPAAGPQCLPPPSPSGSLGAFQIDSEDESDELKPNSLKHPGSPVAWQAFSSGGEGLSQENSLDPNTSPPPLEEEAQHNNNDTNMEMSNTEMELCRRLDDEYERALEEREVAWKARYTSVRQSAFLSSFFMILYLIFGCLFYDRHTDWRVCDSLIFTVYTITTVGYGNHDIPTTATFQLFTICYILVGIAAITVLAAHMYQFIVLEATKVQFSRDKADLTMRGGGGMFHHQNENGDYGNMDMGETSNIEAMRARFMTEFSTVIHERPCLERTVDWTLRALDTTKHFLKTTQAGQIMSIFLPFCGLILFGAAVVGPIEGWTVVQSIYWAVVTLTTVGFGDYYPTKNASIWFCIFYLPSSLFFMSFFLAHVAKSYIKLHSVHVARLETRMRNEIKRARREAERLALSNATDHHYHSDNIPQDGTGAFSVLSSAMKKPQKANIPGFESLATGESDMENTHNSAQLFGSSSTAALMDEGGLSSRGLKHRDMVIQNSIQGGVGSSGSGPNIKGMGSMKAVIRSLKSNNNHDGGGEPVSPKRRMPKGGGGVSKPSFATRVLVQERMAKIIAMDIAGYQSAVVIKENTLSITIDSLKHVVEKWIIPRRARKAFRSVAFQALFFVGEHDLITNGADALFEYSPYEFHGLFSPLLASMGDAETMESWLASTDVLADVELKNVSGVQYEATEPVLT